MPPLPVHHWPEAGAKLAAHQQLVIVALRTPESTIRDNARHLVRTALREMLAVRLDCPPSAVPLCSTPGQALCLAQPYDTIGLAVSHEAGLSLAAINFAGPLGIDLMRIPEGAEWQEQIPTLALEYMGPVSAREIAALPKERLQRGFTEAWTRHEASLKCLGIGMLEWQAALAQRLAACRVRQLALPAGYVGAVALGKQAL